MKKKCNSHFDEVEVLIDLLKKIKNTLSDQVTSSKIHLFPIIIFILFYEITVRISVFNFSCEIQFSRVTSSGISTIAISTLIIYHPYLTQCFYNFNFSFYFI